MGKAGRGSARELGLRWFAGLGPSGKQGREAGRSARKVSRPQGRLGQNEDFSFSFSFLIISKHFQMILKPNLNLNQNTHLKILNATA
jgi:hypothetical protein